MTFDQQPTLRGALLELRPLRADDWTELFAVASDPLIWEQHPQHDRWTEPVFREFFRVALESGSALLAVDLADGRIIGSSRYHAYSEQAREVEIGWTFLARSHWGGRYNGEMKRLMIGHAFGHVDAVVFVIGARNLRSQQAVRNIGAVFAGPLAEGDTDTVVYRLANSRAG